MATFVADNFKELDDEGKEKLQSIVVALSAEAHLPAQADADKKAADEGTIEKGRAAIAESFETSSCVDCHKFRDDGSLGTAPDLTGYGSLEWLKLMIGNPEHERMYEVGNDRMPAFAAHADNPTANLLTAEQIDMLARWIRGDARAVEK